MWAADRHLGSTPEIYEIEAGLKSLAAVQAHQFGQRHETVIEPIAFRMVSLASQGLPGAPCSAKGGQGIEEHAHGFFAFLPDGSAAAYQTDGHLGLPHRPAQHMRKTRQQPSLQRNA